MSGSVRYQRQSTDSPIEATYAAPLPVAEPRVIRALNEIESVYGDRVEIKPKELRKFGRSEVVSTARTTIMTLAGSETEETLPSGKVITTLGVQARWYKTDGLTGLGAKSLTIKRLAPDNTEIGGFILDMDDTDPTGSDKQRAFNTPMLAVSSTNGGVFENTKVQIGFNADVGSDETHYFFYSYAVQEVS